MRSSPLESSREKSEIIIEIKLSYTRGAEKSLAL
jgi:hypothetical protein